MSPSRREGVLQVPYAGVSQASKPVKDLVAEALCYILA